MGAIMAESKYVIIFREIYMFSSLARLSPCIVTLDSYDFSQGGSHIFQVASNASSVTNEFKLLQAFVNPKNSALSIQGAIGEQCGLVVARGFRSVDREAIVRMHNKIRAITALGMLRQAEKPPITAGDMMQMSWDPELAYSAQSWADQCRFGADAVRKVSRFEVGQNTHFKALASEEERRGARTVQWSPALNTWYNEVTHASSLNRTLIANFRQYFQAFGQKFASDISNDIEGFEMCSSLAPAAYRPMPPSGTTAS